MMYHNVLFSFCISCDITEKVRPDITKEEERPKETVEDRLKESAVKDLSLSQKVVFISFTVCLWVCRNVL